ncbi:hypothetical protein [Acinetobacter sp. MD2]|uniref:hypothetical protein n=1 Tax=Acinetobacter sp. MD2 TaxID=2600066 RepID=UPI002D1F545A|nr:hypothetical protein [Acinetobacter sp. MD2]MEB3767722.1 hypothetical protein [Acinetobacter sp. MD2]
MNQLAVYESKKSRLARVKQILDNNYAKVGAAATVTALTIGSAHAADGDSSLDVTAFQTGLQSVSSNVKIIFAAALVVLGLFVAWRYTKRGANSA